MKKKIVVIGNGMAGARVVEEIMGRVPGEFDFVMFGAEPYGNYNRILLSNVLNQTQEPEDIFINPLNWYKENNIVLHAGVKVFQIDTQRKIIFGRELLPKVAAYGTHDENSLRGDIIEESYDYTIIATGSRPFVPPMEGFGV
ncbi:MAG: FAD-dependent oxidoreductase, partial [Patescibacteria group bacterium]